MMIVESKSKFIIKSFADFMAIEGECFRKQKGRETLMFSVNNQNYFIKKHFGVGWSEIFKDLLSLRLPIVGAKNEWLALKLLEKHNIKAATPIVYGEQGWNPATKKSFLVTEEITGIVSLEEFCANWKRLPPSIKLKRKLIDQVAKTARKMHELGINHRDFYICHFLLKMQSIDKEPVLYVMDLHRAQIRESVPFRWLCKDLAGLYFSSMDIGLTKRDVIRFLKTYYSLSWEQVLSTKKPVLKRVEQWAHRLYERDFKKPAPVEIYFKDSTCS